MSSQAVKKFFTLIMGHGEPPGRSRERFYGLGKFWNELFQENPYSRSCMRLLHITLTKKSHGSRRRDSETKMVIFRIDVSSLGFQKYLSTMSCLRLNGRISYQIFETNLRRFISLWNITITHMPLVSRSEIGRHGFSDLALKEFKMVKNKTTKESVQDNDEAAVFFPFILISNL